MANKKNKNQGGSRSLDAASDNDAIRVLKVWVERKASKLGTAIAKTEFVTNAMSFIQAKVDGLAGQGSFQALLSSDIADAAVAGLIQAPKIFSSLAAATLGINPDLGNEILQEGADKFIVQILEDTSNLLKGKNEDQKKRIIADQATVLDLSLAEFLRKKNSTGLEKVWFDQDLGLAHKAGCDKVERKPNLVKDIIMIDVRKRGGKMTTECSCVGFTRDPGGPLDEVLARMSSDERDAILAYILTLKDPSKIMMSGNKRSDITVAKLGLVLKMTDPGLKRTQLFHALGYEEEKKPTLSEVGHTFQARAVEMVTDKSAGERFIAHAEATTRYHRDVRTAINSSPGQRNTQNQPPPRGDFIQRFFRWMFG